MRANIVLVGVLAALGLVPAAAAQASAAPAAPASPLAASPFSCTGDAGSTVNVLHAGSLSTLVRSGLAPAFATQCGGTVTDHSDPAVQLADEIKDGSVTGDIYMSADARVDKTLMGARNGDWVRWYMAFARNQEVISYTTQSPFYAELEKALIEACSGRLASFKVPRAVYVVEEFPLGTLDKILKNRLREMADEQPPV